MNGILKDSIEFTSLPILQTTVTNETVNNDINLQLYVTKFYYNKTKKWIEHSERFKRFININFRSKKGKKFIHKLLAYIVKKYSINWYDLRRYHKKIKLLIYHKLKKFN